MLGGAYGQSTSTPAPGSTPAEAQRHEQRVDNQKTRIENGVKSGQLTPEQGKAMGRNLGRINKETQNMKAKNGGQLSEKQEARIHNQMNRSSRRIATARH
jgi:hypothetical protein